MILRQITEVLNGDKTQTRRIVKPGEYEAVNPLGTDFVFTDDAGKLSVFYPANETREITTVYTPAGRTKWRIGNTYAIVPERRAASVYYKRTPNGLSIWDNNSLPKDKRPRNLKSYLKGEGFNQMRIKITAIRQEPLQAISEDDAIAEGLRFDHYHCFICNGSGEICGEHASGWGCDPCHICKGTGWKRNPIGSYRGLWESINGKGSWDANPHVWVIEFELAS